MWPKILKFWHCFSKYCNKYYLLFLFLFHIMVEFCIGWHHIILFSFFFFSFFFQKFSHHGDKRKPNEICTSAFFWGNYLQKLPYLDN